MTGVSIEIELREGEARAALRGLLSRMDRRAPFFQAVGDLVVGSAKERFRTETDPDGRPWAPHAASTIRARIRNQQTPLTILSSNSKRKTASTLRGNISYEVTDDRLTVGSEAPYAAIHQLGGTINKPAGTRWMAGRRFAKKQEHPEGRDVAIAAHQITIPARPFLGLTRADEDAVLKMAEGWLRG